MPLGLYTLSTIPTDNSAQLQITFLAACIVMVALRADSLCTWICMGIGSSLDVHGCFENQKKNPDKKGSLQSAETRDWTGDL